MRFPFDITLTQLVLGIIVTIYFKRNNLTHTSVKEPITWKQTEKQHDNGITVEVTYQGLVFCNRVE